MKKLSQLIDWFENKGKVLVVNPYDFWQMKLKDLNIAFFPKGNCRGFFKKGKYKGLKVYSDIDAPLGEKKIMLKEEYNASKK